MEELSNLFKSTRVERTTHIVAMMLIPVAFANTLNFNLLILASCCILLYSGFSIHNAIKDNDFVLPKYANAVFISMVLLSILISVYNWVILTAVISWIILGYLYNTVSRKILFMDISILNITNFSSPVFFSALLLHIDLKSSIFLSVYIYCIYWFILNIKNMNGWEDDKLRKYKTIATEFKNQEQLLKIFFLISYTLIISSFFIFKLSDSFLVAQLIIFVLIYFVFLCINSKEWKLGLKITRSIMLFITVSFLIGKNSQIAQYLLFFSLIHCSLWLPELIGTIKERSAVTT